MKAPVVRVSIGTFEPENMSSIEKSLMATKQELEPGIRALRGYLGFSAGIDRVNNAMINVSTWDSVESAKQLDNYQPMLDLGRQFTALGVTFQRPILNFESIWEFD